MSKSKRYSILQARLEELESMLPDLLLHHDLHLSEDFTQKFGFVRNLLSAEMSSSPSKKPRHLQHLALRTARLEEAMSHEQFDMPSSCSCTESCFNDDGERETSTAVPDFAETHEGFKPVVESTETEDFAEGYDGEKKKEEEGAMVEWEGEAEKEKKRFGSLLVYEDAEDQFLEGFGHGKKGLKEEVMKDIVLRRSIEMRREGKIAIGPICGAMACGIVVGMVLMGFTMLKFCGYFHFEDQTYFTIPT